MLSKTYTRKGSYMYIYIQGEKYIFIVCIGKWKDIACEARIVPCRSLAGIRQGYAIGVR